MRKRLSAMFEFDGEPRDRGGGQVPERAGDFAVPQIDFSRIWPEEEYGSEDDHEREGK